MKSQYLHQIKILPYIKIKLQEKIFLKLFATAEIANYNPQERTAYRDSVKYYRDIKNVIGTAYEEAYGIAYVEGRTADRKASRRADRREWKKESGSRRYEWPPK